MKSLILSLKTFFTTHLLKICTGILAFLLPVKPLIIATFIFCLCDFITGIAKAKKLKTPIASAKMQKKVFDLIFYYIAIILAYYLEFLFSDIIKNFPIKDWTAVIILTVEFWSILENISALTGVPLNKDKFFDYINKLRGFNPDTKNNDKDETI